MSIYCIRDVSVVLLGITVLFAAAWARADSHVGAERQGDLTASEQSAVVTALMLVNGYALPNQYVLVKHENVAKDTHRITIWVKSAKKLPEAGATDVPPTLLAVVETSRRKGAQVKYQGKRLPPSGNEAACRAAVAYRAQQGWLPSGFWMTCNADGDKRRVFFHTEPNRWPGDHCTVYVSDSGIRYIGGR